MKKLRIMVAEDNIQMNDILKDFISQRETFEFVGAAYTGEDTIKKIYEIQPDVVLLDLMMPHQDGFSVLEVLAQNPPPKRPHIIVTSSVKEDAFVLRAMELGVDYYMIKPYRYPDLLDRVELLMDVGGRTIQFDSEDKEFFLVAVEKNRPMMVDMDTLTTQIEQELLCTGIPANILGFSYILDVVQLLISNKRGVHTFKQIYAEVADKNRTPLACVESAIRNAIDRIDLQNNPMASQFLNSKKKLTSTLFLTLFAQHIDSKLKHQREERKKVAKQ